ncbi:cell division control protein 2 homolog 2-like [Camellia sinensis]|uniref:cell division control protein 2 homolog 2-like n=1 Tax=Camellia sinensis TaxID=4442 RepID=UPI0010355873|nr:cell division control protein 2 homolog 2-like [Camellia sinensis]
MVVVVVMDNVEIIGAVGDTEGIGGGFIDLSIKKMEMREKIKREEIIVSLGAQYKSLYFLNKTLVNRLLDVACDDYNKCHLIFEYLDLDLKKFMENNPLACLNKQRIKNFLHQILLGVAYCHKRGVMHRDLKPANLLLDLNASVVKIADFGLARTFQIPIREYSPEVVTLWYRPPEILLGSRVYSTPVDVWSVGCIFAEMVMHQPLFDGHSKISHLHQIFRIMGTPDETTWPGVTSLPNYSLDFPKHNPENLKDYFPQLKPAALDLLSVSCCFLLYFENRVI